MVALDTLGEEPFRDHPLPGERCGRWEEDLTERQAVLSLSVARCRCSPTTRTPRSIRRIHLDSMAPRGTMRDHPKLSDSSATRRLDNASFSSSTSTATMSEFDPYSPLNIQRAADPWHGNSLVGAITSTRPSDRDRLAATTSQSLKVFVEDRLDDEWGDFVNGGASTAASRPHIRNVATQEQQAEDYLRSDDSYGWERLPTGRGSGRGDDTEDDVADDELNDGAEDVPPRGYSSHRFDNRQYRDSTAHEEPPSIAQKLFTRLASFVSSPTAAAALTRKSSFSMPPRNYDSYDVTFEKGPIGLELETDWYGRQAVVKGFKRVNGEDGPAKNCGVIRVGDVLTAIDGESCLELGFQDTLGRLREVSKGKHTLHFKSLEAAGDLSIYNQDSDIIQAKKFIHQHKSHFYKAPQSNGRLILGCVERLVGETVTTFNFHREDTGEFLLACSCSNERKGAFIFHTLQDSHLRDYRDLPRSEDSAVYLGQMIPNFIGTEFTIVDHQQKRRNELGFIEYDTNVFGRVPNYMKVVFPKQPHQCDDDDSDSESETDRDDVVSSRPRAATTGSGMGSNNATFNTKNTMMDRNGTISERYRRLKQTRRLSIVERLRSFSLDDLDTTIEYAGTAIQAAWRDDDDQAGKDRAMRMKKLRASSTRDTSTPYGAVEQEDYDCDLLTFETKKPSWNEELGAWTLNFQGRVKMASKKNFLIVPEVGNEAMEAEFGEERSYLRFGKVTKTRFALDYQAPMSPIIALAIACSSFAHKIAVT
ncbi:hypothetical protein PINS_up009922 [Pythium insidiosum]|nr:hypothetical protein PINS_up009922 [Pythium insidiosum]